MRPSERRAAIGQVRLRRTARRGDGAPGVFTRYVASLGPVGEPADRRAFQALWSALRGALRRELRRRGLWLSSPSYLGIYGWQSWQAAEPRPGGAGRRPASGDALDELAADCYAFVFIERLRGLRAHLRRKPNVDGLVWRSIRNFLHDTQRRQDPLGFRVFRVLKRALAEALEAGELALLKGGPHIGNASVFGRHATVVPFRREPPDLGPRIRPWNDELLPDLVTAFGSAEQDVVARLRRLIGGLVESGVEVFGFKDVIDPLKHDVRVRWAALFDLGQGETAFEDVGAELAAVVRVIRPDSGVEERDSFDKLVDCVDRRLDAIRVRRPTRRHLWTLWRFLQAFAAESAAHSTVPLSGLAAAAAAADVLPSRRAMSAALGIPRDRFRDLLATLGQLLEACSPANSARSQVNTVQGVERASAKNRRSSGTADGSRAS